MAWECGFSKTKFGRERVGREKEGRGKFEAYLHLRRQVGASYVPFGTAS